MHRIPYLTKHNCMIPKTTHNRTLLSGLIWIAILLCAIEIFHSQSSYASIMWILLCGAVGLAGYSLGNKPRESIPEKTVASNDASNQPVVSAPTHLPAQQLHNVIDELTLLHTSSDLYERYQCFIRLVEDGLRHALGPCCATLWCLDRDQKHLVERLTLSDDGLAITIEMIVTDPVYLTEPVTIMHKVRKLADRELVQAACTVESAKMYLTSQ